MKISTKGRYAIRLMIDIGVHGENYVRLKDIARRQDISVKYLEQIIGNLQKSGLLLSSRGAQGGYKLARPPKDYTIGEILKVTEGNIAPVSCLEDELNLCSRKHLCSTIEFWEGLNKVINDYLESKTLDQLIEVEAEKQQEAIEYNI